MRNVINLFYLNLAILLMNPINAGETSFLGIIIPLLSEVQEVEEEVQPDCSELVPTLLNTCVTEFDQYERDLSLCMQKRDQCLTNSQRPDDQSSCQELNQCMRARSRGLMGIIAPSANQLPGCEYFWETTSGQCVSKRPLLGNHHHCPGRRRLSTVMTFGMANSYDSSFNCASHALMLEQHIGRCNEMREQALNYCQDDNRLSSLETLPIFETRVLAQFEQQTFQADPLERREHISDVVRSPIPPRRPVGLEISREGQASGATDR
jgi:hypothetical protein